MNKEHISWITTVPASDINFIRRLREASDFEIYEAIKIMTGQGKRGNAKRIAACKKEIGKREKERGYGGKLG